MPHPSSPLANETPSVRMPTRSLAVKIALGYVLLSAVWVLCTGWLVHRLVQDDPTQALLENIKGWLFVLVSGVVLGVGLERYFREIRHFAQLLQESEERYRALFENQHAIAIIVDSATGSILDANSAACRFYGWSREQMRQMRISEINSLPTEQIQAAMDRARRPRGHALFPHRRADGSICQVEVFSGPVTIGGREVLYSTIHDVTARLRAEQELRKWADAFEHCAHGIALGEPQSNTVLACNPRLAQMLESTVQAIQGWRILTLYVPQDHERLKSWIAEADRVGHVRYESRMVRADGSSFPVQMDVVSVRDGEGKPVYRVATAQDITERKRAEAERERLARQRQLALSAAKLGWWHYDPATRIATWDDRYREIFGVAGHESPNDLILARIHPEDRPRVLAAVEAALSPADPQPYMAEYRLSFPDGSLSWVKAHGLAEFAGEGAGRRAVSFVGTVEDITRQRQTEAELRRQAAMIESLLDSIPDIVFFKDLKGVYLGCNPAFAEFVGRPREEFVGKTDHELFPQGVADLFCEYDRRMLASRTPRHNEEWVDYPNGRRVLLDTLKTPYWGPDGELLGVLGISRDITARYQAQQALARLNQQNQLILQSAAEGILGLDLEDRLIFVNAAAAKMLGYPAEELLGLPAHSTWHHHRSDGRPYLPEECLIRAAFHGQTVEGVSTEVFWRKDGTSFPVEYTSTPIREEGRVVGCVVTFNDITGRKRAEEALSRSEERLRLALEATRMGTFDWDLLHNRLTWSHWHEVLWNYQPGEFDGSLEEFTQRIHPEDIAELSAAMRRCQVAREAFAHEFRVVWPDGSTHWMASTGRYEYNAAGQAERMRGTVVEITDRKQMELALQEREQQLRLFVEHSPAAIAMLDHRMRYLVVSQRWLSDYHLRERNIVGRSHYEVFPEIPERWKEIHRRCLAGATEKCDADPFPRADGTLDWVRWEIRPWYNAEGEVGGLLIFSEVITARKEAEDALRESEFRRTLALDAAKAGTWEWDLSTGKSVWSEELWKLYGLVPHACEASFDAWRQTVDPGQRSMLERALRETVRQGAEVNLEWRVNDAQVGDRWLMSRGRPLRNEAGQITRYLGVVMDISERKRIEETLRQRNEELVRFTYTVSHDLKSPLVTIRTFLGYLERDLAGSDPGRIASDLNYIRRASEKMSRMLEELLDLSRVGRKSNPPQEVRLQTLVQEAQELVAGPIAERRVSVRVTNVPMVLVGDRERLLEVFQNLLDNAVKFLGDQPVPVVEIGVEESEREAVLFVRDNGMGIDPRHQAKLFGLFEKLHPGTPGTGVGLALVKRIIEVHGGRIWAESAGSGQGTTFRFTLNGMRRM